MHTHLLHFREGDAEESLGSPSDPSFSPVSWSISGKYLAGALEKMVNIWQVNGKSLESAVGATQPPFHLVSLGSTGFPLPGNPWTVL